MPYDTVILVIAIAALAVPITVVSVVAVGRIPQVFRSFLSLVQGQPIVAQSRENPQRFRRLISGSHLIFETFLFFGAVAWAVAALTGSLEHPVFNLAFAFWILAQVPVLYRDSFAMAKGQTHERCMTNSDFAILAMGHTGAGILFGISAWVESSTLAVVLSFVFLLWAILNWFVVIFQQTNGTHKSSLSEGAPNK